MVVNRDCAALTSEVDKFLRPPWGRSEGVLIRGGAIPEPSKDTIIDCHSLYRPLERALVFQDFCNQELDIFRTLPIEIMAAVDGIILKSRVIPIDIKRRILPGAV